MKYLILVCALVSGSAYLTAMNDSAEVEEYTDEERQCWDWWAKHINNAFVYSRLTDADKKTFQTGTKITDDSDSVIRSRTNYVKIFCEQQVPEDGIALEHSQEKLLTVVLKKTRMMHAPKAKKPTQVSDIRGYVWAQELNKQEQDAFREPIFKSNPELTEQAVKKFAECSGAWMVQLGEIKEEDVAAYVENEYTKKIGDIRKTYGEKNS